MLTQPQKGTLVWRCDSSCASDSEVGLENWQNRLHEVSARRCAYMTKSLRWIDVEINEIPSFHGLIDIQDFLMQFEQQIPHEQRIAAMDLTKRATPARWWYAHKENIASWDDLKRLMVIIFSTDREYFQ